MTDKEIRGKLIEIAKHYNDDNWPLYDLQNDLEEIFQAVYPDKEEIE